MCKFVNGTNKSFFNIFENVKKIDGLRLLFYFSMTAYLFRMTPNEIQLNVLDIEKLAIYLFFNLELIAAV